MRNRSYFYVFNSVIETTYVVLNLYIDSVLLLFFFLTQGCDRRYCNANLHFSTRVRFKQWLSYVEKKSKVTYIKPRGAKTLKDGKSKTKRFLLL
jgi:hypothetical protein